MEDDESIKTMILLITPKLYIIRISIVLSRLVTCNQLGHFYVVYWTQYLGLTRGKGFLQCFPLLSSSGLDIGSQSRNS